MRRGVKVQAVGIALRHSAGFWRDSVDTVGELALHVNQLAEIIRLRPFYAVHSAKFAAYGQHLALDSGEVVFRMRICKAEGGRGVCLAINRGHAILVSHDTVRRGRRHSLEGG